MLLQVRKKKRLLRRVRGGGGYGQVMGKSSTKVKRGSVKGRVTTVEFAIVSEKQALGKRNTGGARENKRRKPVDPNSRSTTTTGKAGEVKKTILKEF